MLEGSLALLLRYVLQLEFLAFLFRYKTWFEKKFIQDATIVECINTAKIMHCLHSTRPKFDVYNATKIYKMPPKYQLLLWQNSIYIFKS